MRRTSKITLDDLTSERALVAEATGGLELAFTELHRRHAPAAFGLALAITGDHDRAAVAVTEGFARVFTALRADRISPDDDFATALATATRNAAVDRAGMPASPDAFAGLPEHWRSALWLHHVDGAPIGRIAAVLGLHDDAATTLLTRAEQGWVVAHLATLDLPQGPTCRRAIQRMAAHSAGVLPEDEVEHLDRHLDLCADCQTRRDVIATLPAVLAARALPLPDDARDHAVAAWQAAVAAGARRGLSPATEKVLAGVSAFAVAVGVLSFAFVAGSDRDATATDLAAAPVSPLFDEIVTPRPFDLSGAIAGPLSRAMTSRSSDPAPTQPEPTTEVASDTASPAPAPAAEPTPPTQTATAPAPTIDTPTVDAGDDPVPAPELPVEDAPSVTVGTEIADVPVAVEIGTDPGLTVGPISVGSAPEPGDEPVVVETAESDESEAPSDEIVVDEVADAVGSATGL